MSIILGIIGVILAIGLAIALLGAVIQIVKYLFIALYYLLKWALIAAVPIGLVVLFVYLFQTIGFWTIGVFAVFLFLLWVLKKALPDSVETRVSRVFHEYEMATFDDLVRMTAGGPSEDAVARAVEKLYKQGKIEVVDFGTDDKQLFRWTEKRHYPQGVVTTHITVD